MNKKNQLDDKNLDLVEIKVFQFYDYSVFSEIEKGKMKEMLLTNSKSHWGLIPESINTLEATLGYIKSKAKCECLADVVIGTIYSCIVDKKSIEGMKNIYPGCNEEEVKFKMFQGLYFKNECVVIKGSYPILIKELSMRNNYVS